MLTGLVAPFALIGFALGLVLTLACERVAPRVGLVARPTADRWHRTVIPMMGGVAIVLGTVLPTLVAASSNRNLVVLTVTALAMAVVGFVDDVRRLNAQAKLLAQIVLSAVLLLFGLELQLTGLRLVDVFITLFWLVGITNAFNLLDNMDGLAATIAIVVASFRLLFAYSDGDTAGMQITAAFIGAVAAFLVRNFPPAKIFMGDAGSLFVGFFLAGLSLVSSDRAYSRGVAAVLVIPVLLLLIPIFDTAFVTLTRLLAGRSPAVGGRDHTSHRLVAIGLSERRAVLLFAVLAAASGSVALFSYRVGLAQAVVLLALLVIGLVLLGIHLSRVRVVHTSEPRGSGPVVRIIADFQYKRQVMTLLLDVCFIVLAYYSAYLTRFEHDFALYLSELYGSLPIVLLVQVVTLAAFGLYRGVWRYTTLSDAIRIVKAVTVAVVLSVVVLVYTHRFVGFSRTVFLLDWLLLITLVAGSRVSFRVFGELLRPPRRPSADRVLVYGAGSGGELIVREILNNVTLQRVPVGFIDDDRNKHHTRIHGLPVLGGSDQLETIVRDRRVNEVIVSSTTIGPDRLATVTQVCRRLEVAVRHASLRLD
jgi:UDP-GlcNAc:undecaprenyl-phosphate/decaprenyl-phosphate GlcNAc-1-phosphate transferase